MTFPKYQVRAAHDATGATERLHGAQCLRLTSAFEVLIIIQQSCLKWSSAGTAGCDKLRSTRQFFILTVRIPFAGREICSIFKTLRLQFTTAVNVI